MKPTHPVRMWRKLFHSMAAIFFLGSFSWGAEVLRSVPILCYHRFSDKVADSMTMKTSTFAQQLLWLKTNGYTVIPLESAIEYLKGGLTVIPDKSVVITVDDGHKSVYTNMAPLVREYQIPVTLFIYPSVISNAKYAMTWKQLRELEATTFFRVQSHTYWHPNFKHEKKKLSPDAYSKFVDMQLGGAKQKLQEKMGHEVKYLAWAFGLFDDELEVKAAQLGYEAALTIDRRYATSSDSIMALPRFMIVNQYTIKAFARIVSGAE